MTNTRTERLDAAVSAAGELIAALQDKDPVTPEQARIIVLAAARASVPNFEEWEATASAKRILADLSQ